MAKIIITTIPYWGHINVTLSLGTLLLKNGHDVTWVLAKDMKGLVIPEGGKLFLTNPPDDNNVSHILNLLDSGKSKSAFDGSKFVMEEVLLPLGKLMYSGLKDFIQTYKPDLIIHDEQTYVGGICAHLLNIPYITTHAPPSGVYESSNVEQITQWYFGELEKYQQFFGLPPQPIIVRSKKLGLAFCPRNFSNPHDVMEGQVFVGPCLDVPRRYEETFDFSTLENTSNINLMVSIGTLLTQEAKQFFAKVVEDFKDSPYTVIVIANPDLFDTWPDNFIVQPRVPHLELIKHIDVAISHGGANTVCDCIGMGIPLVVVPMAFDQYYVGDQVAFNEIGIRLKYKRLKVNELRDACDALMNKNNSYRSNVTRFSKIFRAAGGAGKAVELIENFIDKECKTCR